MLDDLTSGSAMAAQRLWEAENKAASHLAELPQPVTKFTKIEVKPRLIGGFLRSTLFNPPLPRLKPQPPRLSMMIKQRIKRREARRERSRLLNDQQEDMRKEVAFLRSLGIDWPEKIGEWSSGVGGRSWETEFNRQAKLINEQFARELKRSQMQYTDKMYIRIMRAKREKYERLAKRAERRKQQKLLQEQGAAEQKGEAAAVSDSRKP